MVLGVLIFREDMGGLKVLSVGIAACAVVILTIGLGTLPWLALVLACTFGAYSLIKKTTPIGPTLSVTGEVLVIFPFAVIWVLGVHNLAWGGGIDDGAAAFGREAYSTTPACAHHRKTG